MTLNGIDISSWQSNINVGKEGVPADFVIVKATGGTGYIILTVIEHSTSH